MMAEAISYQIEPPKIGPDAHEELEQLLQTMHEHGVLRLVNDLIAANTQIASVIVQGLSTEGALNAVQNISVLAMCLSRIEPARLYKVLIAMRDGLDHMSQTKPAAQDSKAPGVIGAYKLLHDDELWRATMLMIEALKVFADGLNRDVEKPITAYSGKPGSP
jgi:uncharacterized protein YjgD (DUF1641 family)